ncbi:X-linked lymphocyte-regulated protein 5C-like isoform X4 [Peromyscus californicus insignis]|uniref:X-linked lymphocyte-regulated protein 5C-like isoform X3 n=1 Tax=Peromyscus californicus insignis TaxID=564181 RepID=UPI0022A67346|nr:X-linked lymphocyte-regulated protein 5C-like isoform X3 [Peromyscus californicus insignis]XP_052597386.1 X-linked lymphocyte-regulated protein 5C-like isoform X4 [Peromyscus californicus insignis]
MEQKVIGCGGISVSSSCLLFAPAQQVPGHMATACGVPVPVSIAVMKLLLGVFTVCAHQHFRSPAQPSKAPAMSSKEQKDMERRAKRPRVDQNLPSDDFQNPDAITPANNPAVDTSEMGSCSSGPDVQEAREPVQKRIPDVKGDVTRYLLAKRKQFEKDINASLSSLNESLQSVFKTQQKSRQELHSMHSQMFESLYHKWLDEVGRAREQEEHLTLIAQQQMKILQKAIEDHETRIENAKDLCDTFLKKAKDLSEHLKAFIGGEESEVKKEISKAQDRVIMETLPLMTCGV